MKNSGEIVHVHRLLGEYFNCFLLFYGKTFPFSLHCESDRKGGSMGGIDLWPAGVQLARICEKT
jgi:hypothetical protein